MSLSGKPNDKQNNENSSSASARAQAVSMAANDFDASFKLNDIMAMEDASNASTNSNSGRLSARLSRKRSLTSPSPSEPEWLPHFKRNRRLNQTGSGRLLQRSQSLYIPLEEEPTRRITRSQSLILAAARQVADERSRSASLCLPPMTAPMAWPPVKATPNRSRSRSVAAVKLPATDEFYCLPFKYGWKRELVMRSSATSNRQRCDVIFTSPGGKKLRSREDIIPLLEGDLCIDNFCFQRQLQQVGEKFETLRQAQPATMRRKSQAANKQLAAPTPALTPAPAPAPMPTPAPIQTTSTGPGPAELSRPLSATPATSATPVGTSSPSPGLVSGKRVPKPKVPKGASPPPEGWTPTMAVKGNARVLAASNGNASSSSSTGGNSTRKRKSSKTPTASPGVVAAGRSAAGTEKPIICVKCQQLKDKQQAYQVGSGTANNYICKRCVKPPNNKLPTKMAPLTNGNSVKKPVEQQQQQQPIKPKNANAKRKSEELQNGDVGGHLIEIGGQIELPGALPPDQLLSEDSAAAAAAAAAALGAVGTKRAAPRKLITPRPQEVVVINGRKALSVAIDPPRPRYQVIPRAAALELMEKHCANATANCKRHNEKDRLQGLVDTLAAGHLSCQLITAVMKTLDLHDRVRMSRVCETWAMIGRERSVWRTLRLRNTRITNWIFCLRDMSRYRTRELDMMGVHMDNPKQRLEGDLRVLKSLRILRTDATEADFIQLVIKRLQRLLELRTTCTSRSLSLAHLDKLQELQVLRIRMMDPKANLLSLQPLQKLQHLRELSLRGISNMMQWDWVHLESLPQLETLVLGSCRGMNTSTFGEQVLPSLKRLRNLRLENHHTVRSFSITDIMHGLATSQTVQRLELINVNVDAEFSRQLGACKSVHELLLMPNYHNNTAYMMHYIMQAINENSEQLQLRVFRLGLTLQLLSVTRALVVSLDRDCVPVALPIPGVPENDILNDSEEQIAYLPVDRLESILHHMMPQAWLTVAKVSQSETTNLKFLTAATAAGVNENVAAAAGQGSNAPKSASV
ncbi:CG2247 [Drosophila busckii]|uniref:CG2247 n=2 Tax=Drosophila busckii TaxID=30019 RepID=A0A0M4EM60_DROBS|nr:CG2247 [Drosophila busckii]